MCFNWVFIIGLFCLIIQKKLCIYVLHENTCRDRHTCINDDDNDNNCSDNNNNDKENNNINKTNNNGIIN